MLLQEMRQDYNKALQTSQSLDQGMFSILGALALVTSLAGVVQLNTLPAVLRQATGIAACLVWFLLIVALGLFINVLRIVFLGLHRPVTRISLPGPHSGATGNQGWIMSNLKKLKDLLAEALRRLNLLNAEMYVFEVSPVPTDWNQIQQRYLPQGKTKEQILDNIIQDYQKVLVVYRLHNSDKRDKQRTAALCFFLNIIVISVLVFMVGLEGQTAGADAPAPIAVYVVATSTATAISTATATGTTMSTPAPTYVVSPTNTLTVKPATIVPPP
jgi:hypothetical protein